MAKFGHLDWTRMNRGESLSQGNRLKEFDLKVVGSPRREQILLGSCNDVANAINRSLLDPSSVLRDGPDSWPYCIDAEVRDESELDQLLTLFTEILTLTRIDGFDEAFALDFHTDSGSESGGNFDRTRVGELAFQAKYRSKTDA